MTHYKSPNHVSKRDQLFFSPLYTQCWHNIWYIGGAQWTLSEWVNQ
jgi:hypothetical protein